MQAKAGPWVHKDIEIRTTPAWQNHCDVTTGSYAVLQQPDHFQATRAKKTRNQVAFKLHGWVIFERRHLNHCFPLFVTRAFICYEAVQSKQISSATRSIENAARGKMAFLWTERNDTNRTAGSDVHAPNTGTTEHNNVKSYKLTEAGTVQQTRGSWQQTSFGSVRTATWKWWRTGKWLFAVIFLKLLQKAVSVMIFFSLWNFFWKKKLQNSVFWDVSSENAWSPSSSGIKIGTADFSELNFTGRNSSMALTRNK